MKNLLQETFGFVMLPAREILRQEKSQIFSTFDNFFIFSCSLIASGVKLFCVYNVIFKFSYLDRGDFFFVSAVSACLEDIYGQILTIYHSHFIMMNEK